MKSKIFLIATCLILAICANAQQRVESGQTDECTKNISLFVPFARSNNFKDAYPFWKAVYDECPAAHINIYIQGVSIIDWLLSQETDPQKKEAIINDMMKLFDDRIKYMGSDPRNRKDIVIARKAQKYNQLKGDNTDYQLVYKWTSEVVDEFKDKTDPMAVSLYMFSSFKVMQNDMDTYKMQYINDYLKSTDILDAQLEALKAANNEKEVENITIRKEEIEQNFLGSGVADCEILQNIYASKVEDNKTDLDFLKETMNILKRFRCNETDVYIAVSEYAYKIEPTAESAMGLGTKAHKNNDIATAEKYYNEAINMSDDPGTKASLYLALAHIANQRGQNTTVKQLALKCLAENPSLGNAYILIASAYAAGGKNLFPDDPILSKCIYYAVVDKLEKARQVDPSVAAEANRLINTYNKFFPSKEEIFMHPSLNAGDNFLVPGWVNETVKIR